MHGSSRGMQPAEWSHASYNASEQVILVLEWKEQSLGLWPGTTRFLYLGGLVKALSLLVLNGTIFAGSNCVNNGRVP